MNYIVAGQRSWTRDIFSKRLAFLPGAWQYVQTTEGLRDCASGPPPRYIFFLHWSEKVPKEILDWAECVCFHMADLPYGRGGSPLQNLVLRRRRTTKVTALRMTEEIDAGPVYMKMSLDLQGSARAIYTRTMAVAALMIEKIIEQNPEPTSQEGEPVVFERRKPAQSMIPADASLDETYDYIRMLDAEGYPHAFRLLNELRFEYTDAHRIEDALEAKVRITKL